MLCFFLFNQFSQNSEFLNGLTWTFRVQNFCQIFPKKWGGEKIILRPCLMRNCLRANFGETRFCPKTVCKMFLYWNPHKSTVLLVHWCWSTEGHTFVDYVEAPNFSSHGATQYRLWPLIQTNCSILFGLSAAFHSLVWLIEDSAWVHSDVTHILYTSTLFWKKLSQLFPVRFALACIQISWPSDVKGSYLYISKGYTRINILQEICCSLDSTDISERSEFAVFRVI